MKSYTIVNGLGHIVNVPFEGDNYFCPICGTDQNGYPAYQPDGNPSNEICPGCGIQFGDDDVPKRGTSEITTADYFQKIRIKWLNKTGWQEADLEQLKKVLGIVLDRPQSPE